MTSKKNLLLIGLVNQDKYFLGDTQHYNRLHKYLSENFLGLVYSISISNHKKNTSNFFYVKYPKITLIRLFYWNFYIAIMSIFLVIMKKIDIVYMRFNNNQIILPLLLMLFNIKYALEINGIPEKRNKYLSKLHKKIMHSSKFIIGAPGYMEYVYKEFKVSRDKLNPISLGYNFSQAKIYDPKEIASKLNLDHNILYYTFIGNIQSYQGLSYIVKAIGANKKVIPEDVKFLIIGDGPEKDNLINLVSEFSVENYFQFLSRKSKVELDEYLSLKSIGLSTFSPNRGLHRTISGLKTFDYLSHRMPILTSIMDEKARMIEDDRIGWVIESFESNDVLNSFFRSYNEYGKAKKNVIKKYREYCETFKWENRFKVINNSIQDELGK